jgi:hypothetical protein
MDRPETRSAVPLALVMVKVAKPMRTVIVVKVEPACVPVMAFTLLQASKRQADSATNCSPRPYASLCGLGHVNTTDEI